MGLDPEEKVLERGEGGAEANPAVLEQNPADIVYVRVAEQASTTS
jgi:hypothetical protein